MPSGTRHEVALMDAQRGRVRRMTFCELEQAAGRTATLLGESGLRAGDTVLVFHPMSQELYVALGALLRQGRGGHVRRSLRGQEVYRPLL